MNKPGIAERLALAAKMPKRQMSYIIDLLLEVITKELQNGQEVKLSGFGNFRVMTQKSRRVVHPHRLTEDILLPPIKVVKFRPGKILKELIKNN